MLHYVLTKYDLLFDVTLGTWETKPMDIKLHPGAKPYYDKPYLVPRAQKAVFGKEVERMCQLGY